MSHNTLLHRFVRIGVRPLVATSVTPNQVTTLRIAAGLAAAAAFAVGEASWYAWGSGIFVISMLLDRADGELARLSGKTSQWGHNYDLVSDALCNVSIFVGLGIGLRGSALGDWAIGMGLVAGIAVSVAMVGMLFVEPPQGEGEPAAFDPDDAMLAVPAAAAAGWPDVLLLAACVGAPIFALYVLFQFLRQRRAGNG